MAENRSGATESVERFLESKLESVDEAEELVVQIAERAGFDEDDLHKIAMSVRETMVNAVVHGNRYNAHKKVHVTVSNGPEGRLEIKIADQGEGFEQLEVPDPLAEENLLSTSGRGIFLMRAFMDEFDVVQGRNGGAEIVMSKKLPEPGSASPNGGHGQSNAPRQGA
jgi:serine/threonine-protein kinase RsbW